MLYCFDGLRIVVDDSQRHGIHNVAIVQLLWDRSLPVFVAEALVLPIFRTQLVNNELYVA